VFATDDTIVAISTPPGRGGLGVIRLSGPDSCRIATALLNLAEPLTARHATFGHVHDPVSGKRIDQVIATWFAAPHSYTGDDVIELSGHGSPMLLATIVAAAVAHGARPAEPGEFTLRAYLNGRLDLPQAEAVADLVEAVTPLQARAAMDQLEGTLTAVIGRIDASLFDLSARLEASLDFPDEGFHFITREDAAREIAEIRDALSALIVDGRAGRVIREGRTVVITGRPNAGKSSLFNALAGAPRAIVTEIPGTTRDLLTERVDVNGLALTIVDTAGVREARDEIEAEGVRRARQAQQIAALTLVIADGSEPLLDEDRALVEAVASRALVVQTKADLPPLWAIAELGTRHETADPVSAMTGQGLGELREKIAAALLDRDVHREPPAITNIRHLTLVEDSRDAVERAMHALVTGATEELILVDLARARECLEQVTGRREPDDLLLHIFTRFCIGK
jgi:tRNA modification GTPase